MPHDLRFECSRGRDNNTYLIPKFNAEIISIGLVNDILDFKIVILLKKKEKKTGNVTRYVLLL